MNTLGTTGAGAGGRGGGRGGVQFNFDVKRLNGFHCIAVIGAGLSIYKFSSQRQPSRVGDRG